MTDVPEPGSSPEMPKYMRPDQFEAFLDDMRTEGLVDDYEYARQKFNLRQKLKHRSTQWPTHD